LMLHAVEAYYIELSKPPGVQCHGACTICHNFEKINLKSMSKLIKVSFSILRCLAARGNLLTKARVAETWLTIEKAELVIVYIEELKNCGFPLSHKQL
ncbi:hypothetical protein BDR06DRAFT_876697, partial [Suillus hirtellus]